MSNIETPEEFAAKLSDRQHTAPYIASLITARDASLRAESATLLKTCGEALKAVDALINDSRGVYGLHLNGDHAPWATLRTGGDFEAWLSPLDTALAALREAGVHDA